MNRFWAFIVGIILAGVTLYFANDILHLQRHGVHVTGKIVDAVNVHEVSVGRHGIDSSTDHRGVVEFTPEAGGRAVHFSASFWSRQTIGDTAKVLYDRDDPSNAKVDTWLNWLLPGVLGFFAGVCLLYALGLISGDGFESTDDGREWTILRWFD